MQAATLGSRTECASGQRAVSATLPFRHVLLIRGDEAVYVYDRTVTFSREVEYFWRRESPLSLATALYGLIHLFTSLCLFLLGASIAVATPSPEVSPILSHIPKVLITKRGITFYESAGVSDFTTVVVAIVRTHLQLLSVW